MRPIKKRMATLAGNLKVANPGTADEIQARLERALAVLYMDSYVLECNRCGFTCPDVDEIESCPGCGVAFPGSGPGAEEPKAEEMQAAEANVVKMDKRVRQAEDKEQREANVRVAEAKSAKKLEELEGKIDELTSSVGRIEFDVGKYLSEIYKIDVWQVGDYKSFNDYVVKRFDFTKQTARALMRISEIFTREEASEIPVSQLKLLVTIPDELEDERRALIEKVKKDQPTFRELAEDVKAKRAEAGLDTQRSGMEDGVHLACRLKYGVVCEGEWKATRGKTPKRVGRFEVGDVAFVVEDLGDEGFVIKLPK